MDHIIEKDILIKVIPKNIYSDKIYLHNLTSFALNSGKMTIKRLPAMLSQNRSFLYYIYKHDISYITN